jgi:hypothetical protein
MGGGSYHSDVSSARQQVSSNRSEQEIRSAFSYSERATAGKEKGAHRDVLAKAIRECCDSPEHPLSTPIVLASDVTRSRGNDAKVIFAKLPAFMAALKLSEIVPDPSIMWMAFGDANSDKAPVQACQFEADRRLDDWLGKLWLEEGGGGTGEESAELVAWFLANRTKLDSIKRGAKGYAFFTTDEAPYPSVSKDFVQEQFGVTIPKDLRTEKVFQDLSRLYTPFVIFPRSTLEERKEGINQEVKQRLERLGGRFKDVDLRITLIWNTRDDLDLHCITPNGEHISYLNKQARCGGYLDVDQNVCGDNPKPVENIRWAEGSTPTGTYTFYVKLFRYHERDRKPISFALHIDNGGEISELHGSIAVEQSDSEKHKLIFRGKKTVEKPDILAPYQESVILEKWERYVPPAQILRINDPASIVETMLGAMALNNGTMDLASFVSNMKERRVAKATRDDVHEALSNFAKTGIIPQVDADVFG